MKFKRIILVLLIACLALAGEITPHKFVWFTDTHIGTKTGAEDLEAAVADANLQPEVDFVIVSGDLTEMDIEDNLAIAKSILDKLKMPYYAIPGNHELKWTNSGGEKFNALYCDDRFVFEFGGITYIGLHQGPLLRMGPGYFAPEDLRWLEVKLAEINREQPIIFITHYPLDNSVANWYEFTEIVKDHNVRAVMHGHEHRNDFVAYDGIPGLKSRSTLRRPRAAGGYSIVKIDSDSMYVFEKDLLNDSLIHWQSLCLTDKVNIVPATVTPFETGNDAVETVWSLETNYSITSQPVQSGNTVIIANAAGKVLALDIETGNKAWEFQATNAILGGCAAVGNRIVFGTLDSLIYGLDAKTGKKKWQVKVDGSVLAPPSGDGKMVYIGTGDGCMLALKAKNGKRVWQFDGAAQYIETKPLVTDEAVIFSAWDEYLYSLDKKSGDLNWKWNDGGNGLLYSPAACWPVMSGENIYIVAPDRVISEIDAETGKTIRREATHKVRESLGISEDRETLFFKTMWDSLVAIQPKEKEMNVLWKVHTDYGFELNPAAPIESDGVLYVCTDNGLLIAVDAATGEKRWSLKLSWGVINPILPVDSQQIIVSAIDGTVRMLKIKE